MKQMYLTIKKSSQTFTHNYCFHWKLNTFDNFETPDFKNEECLDVFYEARQLPFHFEGLVGGLMAIHQVRSPSFFREGGGVNQNYLLQCIYIYFNLQSSCLYIALNTVPRPVFVEGETTSLLRSNGLELIIPGEQ